jgi:hypothetical protein
MISDRRSFTAAPPVEDQLLSALVMATSTARWPGGELLVDLEETVVRDLFAPHLVIALAQLTSPAASALADTNPAHPPADSPASEVTATPLEPSC